MKTTIVILAAGEGTRMKSSTPKSLHRVAGKSMLRHIVDTTSNIEPEQLMVVHSPNAEDTIKEELFETKTIFVEQDRPLGTGHALRAAHPSIEKNNAVIVLLGDVPLIRQRTINQLKNNLSDNKLAILTTEVEKPKGYGRILRDDKGHIKALSLIHNRPSRPPPAGRSRWSP